MSAPSVCPACGGEFGAPAPYPAPRQRSFTLQFTGIVTCGTCGLGMAVPHHSQETLDAFYAAGTYWSSAVGRSRAQTVHERNQCRHRVRHALEALGPRAALRVLDVGAGHGWTAYWLERACARRLASFDFVEPDDECSREIASRLIVCTPVRLASLPHARAGYDLIFLNHVLEHVAHPLACVSDIKSLLAPDGVAYLEMPHADQRFKPDVFPHTWFFTPRALAGLADRCRVATVLCEIFGRMPTTRPADRLHRVAFRASAALGLDGLAGYCDDRVWRYARGGEGIWIRWIIAGR